MPDLNAALASNRAAIDDLIAASERCAAVWTIPRAAGKWSPSQNVEHVARAIEESANVASGLPSKFPTLPRVLRPVLRSVFFNRVLRKNTFFKGKTNKAMNPERGPATPVDARIRLDGAVTRFEQACRSRAAGGQRIESTVFGSVPVEDYVRFMALHTRHHIKQMPGASHTSPLTAHAT